MPTTIQAYIILYKHITFFMRARTLEAQNLIYCNKSGAHGSSRFNLLAEPCEAAKTAGLRTVKQVNNDTCSVNTVQEGIP